MSSSKVSVPKDPASDLQVPFSKRPGLIAAVVIGVLVFVAIIVVAVYFGLKAGHESDSDDDDSDDDDDDDNDTNPPVISPPVFVEWTGTTPVWCRSEYRVRYKSTWSGWSNPTEATETQGAPQFSLSWAAKLTSAERNSLSWERRLLGATGAGVPVVMVGDPGSLTLFTDLGASPCVTVPVPSSPDFVGYEFAGPTRWCSSQYRVRNAEGIWTDWNFPPTPSPSAFELGGPVFVLQWAAGLTAQQTAALQWRRRPANAPGEGTDVQMTLLTGSVTEFVDKSLVNPCGIPSIPRAAVPVFQEFTQSNITYWARRTELQAAFPDGEWSAWSVAFSSSRATRRVTPRILVSNAAPGQTVLFQWRLEPLPGDCEPEISSVLLERIGDTNEFLLRTTPLWRYVDVSSGLLYDNVNQGRSFYLNRNNEQRFILELDATEDGRWAVNDLLDRISTGFAPAVTGLKFEFVKGTGCLRCFLDPDRTNYANQGRANFRVLPYGVPGLNINYLPATNNGDNTLNQRLGFGYIPGWIVSPQVLGVFGQIGYRAPTYAS